MLTQRKPPKDKSKWTLVQWLVFALEYGLDVEVPAEGDTILIGPDDGGVVYSVSIDYRSTLVPGLFQFIGLRAIHNPKG